MATEKKLVRVAVDAMGGDFAPAELVSGAVQAARQDDVQIALVGDPEQVKAELAKHDIQNLPIEVVPSDGVITEDESPALALRQKPRASILVATGMVKQGHVDACVTMGSTGAAMAAAAIVLGVIEGIDRPALGGPIIGFAPNTIVLDLGTNVDCKPAQMVGFGVLGNVFARQLWGIESPRIAMLSVGSEAGKGNRQVRDVLELFAATNLNFVGNIEANDLPENKADVVVCDGFVGNIVMKLTEGLGNATAAHLREALKDKLSDSDLEQVVADLYDINNRAEAHGGGPLLGVNGVSVVGHGRAKADAIRRAIGTAKLSVETDLIAKLNEELAQVQGKGE